MALSRLHPTRADALTDEAKTVIERLAEHPRVVAVGETGMDMYWPGKLEGCADPATQRDAFAWHIDLAKRIGKPLMIHNRDADADVLDVLRAEGAPDTVIFHCFSSDAEMARTCVANGWLLSLSGTVSFRNATALREAASLIPPQQLLVETDAPFLTPHPYRGAPNEPYCLPYTVRALAELLNRPLRMLRRKLLRRPFAPTGWRVAAREAFRYRLVIKRGVLPGIAHRPIVGIDHVLNILNKIHEEQSPLLRLVVGVTLLALTFAGGFAVAAHKTVTLAVDGTTITVPTMKSRVIDVVTENGFDVGERDDLYPAADQPVHQVRHHRAPSEPADADLHRRP